MEISHEEFCEILDSFLKDYEQYLRNIGFPVRAGKIQCKNLEEVVESLTRHIKIEFLKRVERRQKNVESKRIARVA